MYNSAMRVTGAVAAIGLGLWLLPYAVTRGDAPRAYSLPPLEGGAALPPLPEQSIRNASYVINARLDAEAHTIDGDLVLEWRNNSDAALSTFPFHLYWNAFRNNLSTSARGEGRRSARPGRGLNSTHLLSP